MKGVTSSVAVACVGVLFAGCGSPSPAVTELAATGAWARTSHPGATNGVVYVQISSPTENSITAVSVPASVAAAAELHETMSAGGTSPMPNMPEMGDGNSEMTMAPVDSVDIPAGGSVTFEPGGKHIMLVDLAAPLAAGDTFQLTFTLADGTTMPVDVVVADNAP